MSFSRDLPDPGIKPMSLMSPALAGRFLATSATWEAHRTLAQKRDDRRQNLAKGSGQKTKGGGHC